MNLHITNEKGEIVLQQKEKGKAGFNQFMVNGSRELTTGRLLFKSSSEWYRQDVGSPDQILSRTI